MRAFVRVVETGSFTAAGQSLGSTTGMMSRSVTDLEEHLRTRLLKRSTRRLSLTPAGERYLKRCRQILADIACAEEEASSAHERPAGALRVHCFTSIGQRYVLPAISQYRALHPRVTVELTLSQRMADLFGGDSDVSLVTMASLQNSELISHQLGSSYSILCASPEYVRAHGMPRVPKDLNRHNCLILKTPAFPAHEWTLEEPGGSVEMYVDGAVQVNIAESLAVAIRAGMGIGVLPVCSAIESLRTGALVRVLPHFKLQAVNVYALYPSRKFVDAKTKTWIEFLRTHLPQMIASDMALLEALTQEQLRNDAPGGALPDKSASWQVVETRTSTI